MLLKYTIPAIIATINAYFEPLTPSTDEPLVNYFSPVGNTGKYLWKVEHDNLQRYLKTSTNYVCASLNLRRPNKPRISWDNDCLGSSFEWDVTEYTQGNQKYLQISQNINGIDYFIDTNDKNSFVKINNNSDAKRRSLQFSGNMSDDVPTGILTTFMTARSPITDRLCFNYEQNYYTVVRSKRRKFRNGREIRSTERLLFSKCNVDKCNDNMPSDAQCGSCNWVGNAGTECEECSSFDQYVKDGSCINYPADADCKMTMAGFLDTGIYNPIKDERSCTRCSRRNKKKCSTCAAKVQVQNGNAFSIKSLNPDSDGICSCPDGTNIAYRDDRRSPIICAANCMDKNVLIENDLFKCGKCDEDNLSVCAECAGEGIVLGENGECICTREDWTFDSEANECTFKNKQFVERVNEKPAANLCLMFPSGSDLRIECEAGKK